MPIMQIRQSCVGVFYMLSNSIMLSMGGLSFRYSEFNNDCILSWIGVLGCLFALALLATDQAPAKKKTSFLRNRNAAISVFNGVLIGGMSISSFNISLNYIIPSDTMVVKFFVSILTSICLETYQLKKWPSLASTLSIILGLTGTISICKPQALFSAETLEFDTLIGVFFASMSGLCGCLFLFISRSRIDVPDSWHFLWYMFGAGLFGSFTYRPLTVGGRGNCIGFLRGCAILSSAAQVGCGITAIKAVKLIVPSAAFVFQLFSSAITFTLQFIIFPGIISWSSCIGAALVSLAVCMEVYAVKTSPESASKVLSTLSL